jgi:hypothetical protein
MALDRYGRPLPEPKWYTIADLDLPGYYLWADKRCDWDIARPIGVTKIESGGKVWFEARVPVPGTASVTCPVNELPADSVFYGPFRVSLPPWEKR